MRARARACGGCGSGDGAAVGPTLRFIAWARSPRTACWTAAARFFQSHPDRASLIRSLDRMNLAWGDVRSTADAYRSPTARARGTVAHHDDPERFRAMGVDVRFGQARFRGPGELEVDGVGILRSKRFVIATGAEAWVPPIQGLEDAGYLTNATLFDSDARPEALVVLGGGPIGLELAQVYARLGSRVTVLECSPVSSPRRRRTWQGSWSAL